MKTVKPESRGRGVSTFDAILERSIEQTNQKGVVDFRIDSLAMSLKLSPGNITYHFAKKEEICNMIWNEFHRQLLLKIASLSMMLDLKQLYLVFRDMANVMYNYRGVVMYRGGDVDSLSQEKDEDESYLSSTREMFMQVSAILEKNGYLIPLDAERSKSALFCHMVAMRYWINSQTITSQIDPLSPGRDINQNALLILYSFYPQMTEKGHAEFVEISSMVESNNIDS